jgi:hypothetical protein
MNKSTSVRRLRPQKPVRPVEVTRLADSKEVLDIFNHFIGEARKELRKRERLTLKGMLHKTDCDSVTFMGDTFSLTIDFTEGMLV